MNLKELIGKVQSCPTVRALLPLNQGMLLPAFSLTRGKLCAHFLCHRTAVEKDGLRVWPPEYYLQFLCPEVQLVSLQVLKYAPAFAGTDFETPICIPPRSQEERERHRSGLRRLEELGGQVLEAWDKSGAAQPEEYNELLLSLLTPEQAAACRTLMGMDP